MAIGTNTYTTYDTTGMREDLIDVIANIDPVSTWFQSNIGNARASQRYHEWLLDSLAAPAANVQIEGDSLTATAIIPPVRSGNYCQILNKKFSITETEEVTNKAGRSSEVAYQKANKLKELANDIEYALIINASAVSGGTGTGRQLKGLSGWITSNNITGTGTESQPLTETLFNDGLQAVWNAGGKPSNCLMGAFQKRKIDAFTSNTKNVNADERKLVNHIAVYESPFGTVSLRIHHIMQSDVASKIFILGDMGLWKKAYLRPLQWKELPYTGFARFLACEAELTLESRAEAGSGVIAELTTS